MEEPVHEDCTRSLGGMRSSRLIVESMLVDGGSEPEMRFSELDVSPIKDCKFGIFDVERGVVVGKDDMLVDLFGLMASFESGRV